MKINLPQNNIKTEVRKINLQNITIGGDSALSFMKENNNVSKPLFALEIPLNINQSFPSTLKAAFGDSINSFKSMFEFAQASDCDLICIHFNIEESNLENNINIAILKTKELIERSTKPIILKGVNSKEIDKILLSRLAKEIKKPCIVAFAEENTYEAIVPSVIKNNHILVLRSPIDINLAKELNILSIDAGINPDRIIIDPDMGALGYGLDYGYSIIEKIRQAAFDGDTMLNMPIITFIGEETFKVKEAKSDNFDPNYGKLGERAAMWEIATASAILSAGANILVLSHPQSIKTLKEIVWN